MTCTSPITILNPKSGHKMTLACGHCMHCRLQKTREWSVRLSNELNFWKDSCFITLTYRDDCRPTLPCGKSYLVKSDLQKFIKRMRKFLNGRYIKYFACGEYGDLHHNAHFHLIVFGVSIKEGKEVVKNCWHFGEFFTCPVGSVSNYSIQYVTGYIRKKLNGLGKLKNSYFWCLPSEFQLQSQGLGLRYADEYKYNIIDKGLSLNGAPVGIPRYYIKKIPFISDTISERSKAMIYRKLLDKYSDSYIASFYTNDFDVMPDFETKESKLQRFLNLRHKTCLYNRQKL